MVEKAGGEFLARRGVYDNDYFSGAQVGIYIGDVLVDEVTSISFAVNQTRTPLYGYASTLFDDMAKGHVIVQGQFTVNFKEAGYLWLILHRYRALVKGKNDHPFRTKGKPAEYETKKTIEAIINGDLLPGEEQVSGALAREAVLSLSGFSSIQRFQRDLAGTGPGVGLAENIFEVFENAIWHEGNGTSFGVEGVGELNFNRNRRTDEPELNPFDIFMAFGDFTGDDRIHHTIHKLKDVYLLGSSKQIVIDGTPIQEAYSFIARDLV
jgi:hypothetical protein